MTVTPDSFSMDELKQMLADAPKEEELKKVDTTHDYSPETIYEIAHEALEYATERSHGPLVHKVMACEIINQMFEWHTRMHEVQLEDDEPVSALMWARDAGKFQAIMNILTSINVGREDFITPLDD